MEERKSHGSALVRVMIWGTALSFGIVGVLIGSMPRFFQGDVAFVLSSRSFIGFFVGWVIGWLFWNFILRRLVKSQQTPRD